MGLIFSLVSVDGGVWKVLGGSGIATNDDRSKKGRYFTKCINELGNRSFIRRYIVRKVTILPDGRLTARIRGI